MKKIILIVLAVITVLIYTSCQQVFTYSPLSWAQRDPSGMPEPQKIAYAKSLLSSPNATTSDIKTAYNMINKLVTANPQDADLQLLAADLALGGSGIIDIIGSIDPSDLESVNVEALVTDIDLSLVSASADHVVAAEAIDPDAISPDQYLDTGIILLGKAADEAVGGFSALSTINSGDDGWSTLVQANSFIIKGGGDISDYGISNASL